MFAIQSLKPRANAELEDEKPLMLKVCNLNQHIVCILCAGYFVDATTITECLHTFCKSCIVKYLQTSKHCPMCNIKIHETQPLVNLRPDRTMQDIVFTLVPHLWKDEALRKREFYKSRGLGKVHKVKEVEVKKQLTYDLTHQPTHDHLLSLCLERFREKTQDQLPSFQKKYIRCSVRTCVHHLQKLIRRKLNLSSSTKVNILCNGKQLGSANTNLKHIWLEHWFQKLPPMVLHFKTDIGSSPDKGKPVVENVTLETNSNTSNVVEKTCLQAQPENLPRINDYPPLCGKFAKVKKASYHVMPTGELNIVGNTQLQEPTGTWKTVENTIYQAKPRTLKMVENTEGLLPP
ncbi:polycomb group RING finger protein 1-like [Antedon mediterranea]|uniref:polycomb group RING finger protein 1-like n=1 Tax=Antedon mediterranea TaxID=105859 RepID=UPI003AF7B825